MTYTHLTPTELVMIEAYFNQSHSVSKVAHLVQRSRQTIYNVYCFLKSGGSAISYYEQYKKNKRNCGRRPIVLPDGQQEYIQKRWLKGGLQMSLLVEQSFLLLVRYVHYIGCLKIKPLTLTIYQ